MWPFKKTEKPEDSLREVLVREIELLSLKAAEWTCVWDSHYNSRILTHSGGNIISRYGKISTKEGACISLTDSQIG